MDEMNTSLEVQTPGTETNIEGLFPQEVENLLVSLGQPRYRGRQIFQWIHRQRVRDFAGMSNLSKELRGQLPQSIPLRKAEVVRVQVSSQDGTAKFLLKMADGETIETVLLKYEYGYSVCVSSQVGCSLGCTFCASSLVGCRRNLQAGEMIEQVLTAADYVASREGEEKARISHIVVMGMGEPMLNYKNVLRFLKLAHEPEGLNISYRNMTISTSGIVTGIRQLADEGIPVTLAVSLHAPNDQVRRSIMPVAEHYPLEKLLQACREYADATGRRVTFEYALMDGINDRPQHAKELAQKLKGMLAHVNLIPMNPVPERGYKRSPRETVEEFQRNLLRNGVEATIRRELGTDIDAACGQLRRRFLRPGENGVGDEHGFMDES